MLLQEQQYDLVESEILVEGAEKSLYITGPYIQMDVANRNKRIYPSSYINPIVESYINDYVKTNRALGELEHPARPTINPERASHLITEMYRDGANYIGKAKILNTPTGQIVRALVEGGVKFGVSSRGSGSVKARRDGINEVQKDFKLHCVDIVVNPSAPDAFVDAIMESQVIEAIAGNNMSLLREFVEFLANKKLIKNEAKSNRFQLTLESFEKLIKNI